MAKKEYTFIDLFAGCGGLSEGFMSSGHFRSLAHVEWELPMVQTLRKRLIQKWGETEESVNKKVILFDIQHTDELINGHWSKDSINKYGKYNANYVQNGLKTIIDEKPVDFIIGGPPCQAYSIHGRATDKNSMKNDYRNYLFESFVKVVDYFRPKAFIFENVMGMLSAKPGGEPVVQRIYKAFNEIGYETLSPKDFKNAVFDAYNYDVPQHRERVILIGIKNGEKFSLEDFYKNLALCAAKTHKTVRDAIGNMPPLYPLEKVIKSKGRYISHQCNGEDLHHLPRHCSARDIEIFKTWIGNNMNYCSQQEAINFYKKITGKNTLYRKYRNLEWDKPAPTIVAHLQKDGFMFIHPDIKQLRSITVREAALLMTFPRDYQFIGNRAYCYKMIGNAVPVNFAKAIAQSLYQTLN
ncbi:MAG: DNA cytosine methyltransferase [Porphyromonadaceae bacterium]|nr:DNA cytosine methyltransferase [Porphyromonadaceae bacterium]